MSDENVPDFYIGTDDNGDTIIGTDLGLLPWGELDEFLAKHYPDSQFPPSVIRIKNEAA